MATLTIRDLPDEVRDKLRVRAAEHGRSMEAEVRSLLGAVVAPTAKATTAANRTVRERVERLQAAFEPYRSTERSLVDDLVAELRLEPNGVAAGLPQRSQGQKLDEARAILRRYVPEGTPLVDEFLAGRRAMWGDG